MLVQPKAGKRRIKRMQYYQETKHFPLCPYFYRDIYIRGAAKFCSAEIIQRMRNLQRHWLSLAHLITLLHVLFPETTGHFAETCRIHLPFKYCNMHYNQVRTLRTSAVREEGFFNFPLLPSTAEI